MESKSPSVKPKIVKKRKKKLVLKKNTPDDVPIIKEKEEKKKGKIKKVEKEKGEEFKLNKKLRDMEKQEASYFQENKDEFKNLYPNLNDPNFIIKIAEKKEFQETKFKGDIGNVEIMAEQKCNEERELASHQMFVKNFMSFNTPYNSLLLYHGLGSGKTCAAVGIMEETRNYFKQLGVNKPIYILAQPNVQANFKTEIFDSRKLTHINNIWSMKSCIGNKLLKELNTNTINLSKPNIIKHIDKLIRKSYKFFGYGEFASFVINSSRVEGTYKNETKKKIIGQKLNDLFGNTLIVVDEVHNIRNTGDYKTKKIYNTLLTLAKNVDNLRLLFLSATPMFNDSTEIIPILNLMNTNDNRSSIGIKEVFDKKGNLKLSESGENIGENILKMKANGYVSYVRGENPYVYPYKIYPKKFNLSKSILNMEYPTKTLNGKDIIQTIQYVDIFTIMISSYQEQVYNYLLNSIKTTDITFENLDSFGYNLLAPLLQVLNMSYPNKSFMGGKKVNKDVLFGTTGMESIMKFDFATKKNFQYKTLDYGRIFSKNEIEKYSPKIKNIIDTIITSNGIVLIYSNYLDSGVIPVALALEEMGFERYGETPSFFKAGEIQEKSIFKYSIISGDKKISPNNDLELKACSNPSNKNGDEIKVVLISRAGTEGLDFKNIRQVHILEPWYNMNRIEQTIGRAVRTKSHCGLPFLQRNVMIFLYGTILNNDTESTDLYVYRRAEEKAVQIGKITRLLKQNAVDCILNTAQGNFTEENINQNYDIVLSDMQTINYRIGDKPFTEICDYMESCNFVCAKTKANIEGSINDATYNETFSSLNNDLIVKKIKMIFREYYFLKKSDLVANLNLQRSVPITQVYSALNQLIYDKNEFLFDRFNKPGHLINVGEYYFFQPIEKDDTNLSVFERSSPPEQIRNKLVFPLEKKQNPMPPTTTIPVEKSKSLLNKIVNVELNEYLEEMKQKYETVQTYTGKLNAKSSWYESITKIIPILETIDIKKEEIYQHIFERIIDTTPYKVKIKLLDHLYGDTELDEFQNKIKRYIDTQLLSETPYPAILLLNNEASNKKDKQVMLVYKNKKWNNALPEDKEKYISQIISLNESINDEKKNKMSPLFGYITPFKNTNEMVFKTKANSNENVKEGNKGRRCDQTKKTEIISLLNQLFLSIQKTVTIDYSKLNVTQLCCLQEILLRNLNKKNTLSKSWFLSPEKSIFIINV